MEKKQGAKNATDMKMTYIYVYMSLYSNTYVSYGERAESKYY